MSARKRLLSRAGQIVIPAMLVFPTLFLFVYLIYETAKLSREKIRHQFAMDSAAFVEMTNYSDFLNRTAYVNGAFPMRIFAEGYGDFPAECEGKVDNCQKVMYADMLYQNGVFPRSVSNPTCGLSGTTDCFAGKGQWDIEYVSRTTKNIPRQDDITNGVTDETPNDNADAGFLLFTLDDANHFWHPYELASEIYKLYVQVYSLLGSVEDAQYSVLKRLSSDHSFMKKSYWLNTGDPVTAADALVTSFRTQMPDFGSTTVVHPVCQQYLNYWGNRHIGGGGIQPYTPAHASTKISLGPTQGCPGGGLFQIMLVDPNTVKKLATKTGGDYPGILLQMNWAIPDKNYFNIDFAGLMAHTYPQGSLRTTISLQGDPSNKPSVWPDPTPKFQVRQFP